MADNDAEDFEDDIEEGASDSLDAFQSQSTASTPSSKNTPKPILKVLSPPTNFIWFCHFMLLYLSILLRNS